VQSRKTNSPVKAVVTVAAVLVVVAGGLGYRMYSQHQAELAAAEAARARVETEAKAAQMEFEKKLAAIQKDMEGKLNAVHTEEERARIRAEAAERASLARQEAAQRTHKTGAATASDTPKPVQYKKVDKKKVSDDPLEGIKF